MKKKNLERVECRDAWFETRYDDNSPFSLWVDIRKVPCILWSGHIKRNGKRLTKDDYLITKDVIADTYQQDHYFNGSTYRRAKITPELLEGSKI